MYNVSEADHIGNLPPAMFAAPAVHARVTDELDVGRTLVRVGRRSLVLVAEVEAGHNLRYAVRPRQHERHRHLVEVRYVRLRFIGFRNF